VIGLVQGGCLLEDIRVTVPQRMALQIPAHLAERSQSLVEALQARRVMRLGSPAVVREVPAQLSTSLRGRGIAPQVSPPRHEPRPAGPPEEERELLVLALEASREDCRRLEALNEALQGTLQSLTHQLLHIQEGVDSLVRSRAAPGALPVPQPLRAFGGGGGQRKAEAVPHFIPPTTLEAAEVRINPAESTSTTNVDEAVAALRSLRGKPA
jgi:hypothetical protein